MNVLIGTISLLNVHIKCITLYEWIQGQNRDTSEMLWQSYVCTQLVDKPLIQMCCCFNTQCNVTVRYIKSSTDSAHNTLATVLIIPQISMKITCSIQLTGVVTMEIEVLHNTCDTCTCNFPDMYGWRLHEGIHISDESLMPC